jgi:hypothetical protein
MGISADALDILRTAAVRHAEELEPDLALKTYLSACHAERETVSRWFANSVLLTSSPQQLSFLLPRLPTMFIFSYRHGSTEKPWFIDDTPMTRSGAAPVAQTS